MNGILSIISVALVYLTIHAGTTDSSVISNPTVLQDFYRVVLAKLNSDYENNFAAEQELDTLLLSHILTELSNDRMSQSSVYSNFEDEEEDSLRPASGLQKRSNSDAKRTQDMSRLAMRILKRSGKDSSRVAYRILKKRGSNAARIAMRVLRKRDQENPNNFKTFNRVTKASPYSNIGGYFGGMSLGRIAHLPNGFSGMKYYPQSIQSPSNMEEKRSDCVSNCGNEGLVDDGEGEVA